MADEKVEDAPGDAMLDEVKLKKPQQRKLKGKAEEVQNR